MQVKAMKGQQVHEQVLSMLVIRKMQIKATSRYYLQSVRMAIIKKTGDKKCWGEWLAKETHNTIGENVNWHSYCGKQYGTFSKIKGTTTI